MLEVRGERAKTARSLKMIQQTVWPGNYRTYRSALGQKLVHGVAVNPNGVLVAEVQSARRMRLLIMADPKTMTVTHRCNAYSAAPCWHLALGLELIAFANNRRLLVGPKYPLAAVNAVTRCVKPEDVGLCKDISSSFLVYAGLQPAVGNFSLAKIVPPERLTKDCPIKRGKGLWGLIKSCISPVGGTLK